jgi:hypothetical protein
MEHVRKIMEIMDDEMFPTKREWMYVKICNELKQIHIQLQELTRLKALHAPATIDPSAYIESRTSATIDPSAPPRIIRDAWRDLRTLRLRPQR